MTYRDWNQAASRTNYKRRLEASQQALARALRENRVRDECLALAVETLTLYTEGSTDGVPAQGTLVEIETRLAELEPEETDNAGT